MNIAAGNQAMWARLAQTVGLEPLIHDERFRTVADRVKNLTELTPLLEEKLAEKTNQEWGALLDEAGVANGPILHVDEVFQNPQILHRKMLLEMDHPTAGKIKTLGFPVKLSQTPAQLKIPPPCRGQHGAEILQELGYSPPEIETMRRDKVI
jgi:crotonobetainyl-CoA:carnitine CoA-transferase CaiB-like acyl-CoA transferase